MKVIHTHVVNNDTQLTELALLTQTLSVLSWKHHNKSDKLWLYTDAETLAKYKKYGIDRLYDHIDVSTMERFPKNVNTNVFPSSHKMWIFKNQTAPFISLDVDFVFHDTFPQDAASLGFLHLESPTTYPFPTKIQPPKDFTWTVDELTGFVNSIPVNTSLVMWGDITFLHKYVDRYFEAVTNTEGKVSITKDESMYISPNAAQRTLEQWLLASLTTLEELTNENFTSKSIVPMIAHPAGMRPQDYNIPIDKFTETVNNTMFALLGARNSYEQKNYELYSTLLKTISGSIGAIIPHFEDDTLFDILEAIMDDARKVPNENQEESVEVTETNEQETAKSD